MSHKQRTIITVCTANINYNTDMLPWHTSMLSSQMPTTQKQKHHNKTSHSDSDERQNILLTKQTKKGCYNRQPSCFLGSFQWQDGISTQAVTACKWANKKGFNNRFASNGPSKKQSFLTKHRQHNWSSNCPLLSPSLHLWPCYSKTEASLPIWLTASEESTLQASLFRPPVHHVKCTLCPK